MGQARDKRGAMRGAVYRRDVDALDRLLQADDLVDRLQLAGAGVLVLLAERADARDAVARIGAGLRKRGWNGRLGPRRRERCRRRRTAPTASAGASGPPRAGGLLGRWHGWWLRP